MCLPSRINWVVVMLDFGVLVSRLVEISHFRKR